MFQICLLGLAESDNSTIGDSVIEDVSEVSETNNNLNTDFGDQVSRSDPLFYAIPPKIYRSFSFSDTISFAFAGRVKYMQLSIL